MIFRYCSPMFKMSVYKATYDGIVHPMEDPQYWVEVNYISVWLIIAV